MTVLQKFVPFLKVDEATRTVFGLATDETPDLDGEVVDYEATREAVAEWAKWRNIREMHQNRAVGIAEEIELDDTARSLRIGVHVVDEEAWKKVKAGVYKGFSIGGRKLASVISKGAAGEALRRITKYMMTEISLVDIPCNPSAVFSLVKRADFTGGTMEEEEKKAEDPRSTEGDEKAAEAEAAKGEAAEEASEAQAENPMTAEAVKGLVMEILTALGLVSDDLVRTSQVTDLRKSLDTDFARREALTGLASANDLAKGLAQIEQVSGNITKLASDMGKVAGAVDELSEAVELLKRTPAGSGPVLREIGMVGSNSPTLQSGDAVVLKRLMSETTDPNLRQMLGMELGKLELRSRNQG